MRSPSEALDVGDLRSETTDPGLPSARADDRRREVFQQLAERHLDQGYRLARAILRDPTDAEDATHDAVVQAWRRWPSLRDAARFDAWFSRILVNICRDRLRRSGRRQTIDLDELTQIPGTDAFGASDERDVIGGALNTLSADHQVVLALRYYAELPVKEISVRLGVRPGTVQSRLHYALRRLRREMERAEPDGARR